MRLHRLHLGRQSLHGLEMIFPLLQDVGHGFVAELARRRDDLLYAGNDSAYVVGVELRIILDASGIHQAISS